VRRKIKLDLQQGDEAKKNPALVAHDAVCPFGSVVYIVPSKLVMSTLLELSMPRVATYIDGFNVYFGLVSLMEKRGRASYKWLDYWALSERIMQSSPVAEKADTLVSVKYFTAIVQDNTGKAAKHENYINALESRGVEVVRGKYLTHWNRCKNPSCGRIWSRGEEKQSDVSIAVHLLNDANCDAYDKAILVTGDSDQVPAISIVRKQFPDRKLVLAYPPERSRNRDLDSVLESGNTMKFNRWLAECQLPDPTPGPAGDIFCPAEWRG
jgi:uncharacterized LabA/DUF88 family protein